MWLWNYGSLSLHFPLDFENDLTYLSFDGIVDRYGNLKATKGIRMAHSLVCISKRGSLIPWCWKQRTNLSLVQISFHSQRLQERISESCIDGNIWDWCATCRPKILISLDRFLFSLSPLFIEFLLQHSMVMTRVAHWETDSFLPRPPL